MNYQTLLVRAEKRICFITLNRPEKLNALNLRCKQELRELFADLRTNRGVDVAIVTGAGEKSFAAGTDINELTSLDRETGKEFALNGQAVFDMIQHLGKPVIAAVNGYALGGGCELALACHIRIASENAIFGQPEVNLGLIPGYGGTQRSARLIGPGKTAEMLLTGNQISAAEALRIGLVNKVVPQASLLREAEAVALAILSKAQIAVRLTLKAINISMELPLSEAMKIEATLFGECCGTKDFKEGTRAFLEKRKPKFTGE